MINQTLPFAEWTPDLPDIASGTTEALNVIPHEGSYLPMPSLSPISSALTAYCRGAVSYTDLDGNVESYAGDETKLYRLAVATWADKSNGTYTTGTKNFWRFIQFGERVIATNLTDAIQTKAFGAGTSFAALGGSPPKAYAIGTCRSFIVLGNINDGTHKPSTVQWSGQNLETAWGSSAATQADSQQLAGDGGKIQAIMSGDVAVIFQERSIWQMEYQGPPTIFSFKEGAPGLGTPAAQSVVQYGNVSYFLGQDGFYQYVVGQGPSPIGDKKVDKFFFDSVDASNIHRMIGAINVKLGKIFWAYATGTGDPNQLIIFDFKTGQWSHAEVDTETIYSGRSAGYTLEELDNVNSNLDLLTPSLDDDSWKGGVINLHGFNTSHIAGSFSGAALTSRLETVEMARDDAEMIYINSLRPLVQGSGAVNTVYVGTRNTLQDTLAYGSGITANTIGEHNTRAAARYMRLRCDTSGGFEHAVGVRVNVQVNGSR